MYRTEMIKELLNYLNNINPPSTISLCDSIIQKCQHFANSSLHKLFYEKIAVDESNMVTGCGELLTACKDLLTASANETKDLLTPAMNVTKDLLTTSLNETKETIYSEGFKSYVPWMSAIAGAAGICWLGYNVYTNYTKRSIGKIKQ